MIQRDQLMGWNLLRHPNRLKIQTIDGFCSSLVKQMPYESNMGSMPSIEEESAAMYEKAAKQLINSLGEGAFYDGALASLLAHLDNNYRIAVSLIAQMLGKRDHWLENLMAARKSHGEDLKATLEATLDNRVNSHIEKLDKCIPIETKQELMSLALYAAQNLALDNIQSPISQALACENDCLLDTTDDADDE